MQNWEPLPLDHRFLFRRVDPQEEKEKLLQFFREGYGRNFSWEEYQWFKLSHPYSHSRVYLAQEAETERFAAVMCMIPFQYRYGGSLCEVSLAHSAATHPDFRRLGLFAKINRLLREGEAQLGTPYGLGFPNPAAVPGHLQAGWEIAGEMVFWEKRVFRNRPTPAVPLSRFDERFDSFYLEATQRFDLVHVKDHQILNWRYRAAPHRNYQIFISDREVLQGFAVLKKYQDRQVLKSHLIDFLAVTESAAENLVAAAENSAKGSALLNLWIPAGSPYEQWFSRLGFYPTEERVPIILRSHLHRPLPNFHSPWLTLGDNDVF